MEVTNLKVKEDRGIRGLRITFTVSGQEFEFQLKKKIARQLMRSIFLQVGLDPKLGRGMDTLPDYKSYKDND